MSGAGSSLKAVMNAAALQGVAEATARIFGHVIGNGMRSGHKILRRKPIGKKVLEWYPPSVCRAYPGFTPGEEERLERLERMRRQGKAPPKKGQGKRAAKRK
ncbi:hypothetical protein KP509_09G088200 [Ceratopteris richardii]|uniref:Small ribosomal subunit protein mS33 n=1 Tax=Ceratopteris richardii TaxID=49495 RepID=A0A8T2U4H3_CERRI|nr:hypothetical protein KP509_09G088200 [Ceratopteris richardii]